MIGENMKSLISALLLMIALPVMALELPSGVKVPEGVPTHGHRGFYEIHNALESMSLRISMDSSLNGFIEGKVCDECETIRVTITPATKAYANNVEVPLKEAESRLGRYATVIYLKETKEVSAIRW